MKIPVATAVAGLAAALVIGAGLISGTPHANADDNTYLGRLGTQYWFYQIYGPQKLLAEGHKVCATVAAGGGTFQQLMAKSIDMVQADLSAPEFTASDIANAAVDLLDC